MPVLTPVPGLTRLRAFQLGAETVFKTQVPATRRMPWSFAPTVDPHWTNPTGDTGTLDPAQPPYRMALDVTGVATISELYANDVPVLLAAGVKGGLSATGGGAAKTWTAAPASTSQDTFDTFTGEWFNDATGDAFAATGGVLESFALQYPQSLGPITGTANWRFAQVVYPATPTGSLSVDPAPVPLFAADTQYFIDSAFGSIGGTQLTDTVYDASVTLTNNLDLKRFQNGSNTRFQIASYGRGERVFEIAITLAQSTAGIAESVAWLNANPQERFISILTTSNTVAQAPSTKYSLQVRMGGFWFTRTEQTVGGNTAFQLVGRQRFNSAGLNYPFQITAVTTEATVLAP